LGAEDSGPARAAEAEGQHPAAASSRRGILAIVSGSLVFGQDPDERTLLGITIVCAAGLYTFHRERLRRRAALT
jgi:hypothetical protein